MARKKASVERVFLTIGTVQMAWGTYPPDIEIRLSDEEEIAHLLSNGAIVEKGRHRHRRPVEPGLRIAEDVPAREVR